MARGSTRRNGRTAARTSPRVLSRLECLPPGILVAIFIEVRRISVSDGLSCLLLSSHVFPVALEAYHFRFDIFSPQQGLNLYTQLRRRPKLAKFVRSIIISAINQGPQWVVPVCGLEARLIKVKSSGRLKSSKVRRKRMAKATRIDKLSPPAELEKFETTHFAFGVELLRDLFQTRLTDLTSLGLVGRTFVHTILIEMHFPEVVFPHLKELLIGLQPYEDFCRCCNHPELCFRLSRITSITSVVFKGSFEVSPWPDDNQILPRSLAPIPHSWCLEEFSLTSIPLTPHLPPLLISFAPTLQAFTLQTASYSSTLVDDLQLLPPTLRHFSLTFGDKNSCIGAFEASDPVPRNVLPFVDQALARFPHLESLDLSGPLVSPNFYQILFRLRNLRTLSLGLHVPLDSFQLLRLIDGDQQLPFLRTLLINLCLCPPVRSRPEEAFRRPRWDENFSREGARRCSTRAKARGITRLGTWQCAVRHCDQSDGHSCWRALETLE
ncbi:hypothetical protein JCM3765_003922 [Sporobolomyces pararoseus]